MTMDLLLDVNIVIDICALREGLADSAARAAEKCAMEGGVVWLYSGSVQTYDYNLRRELKRTYAKQGVELTHSQCATLSKAALMDFAKDRQWIAALAGEGDVFNTDDPEDEQLIRALNRFKPGTIQLLTRDSALIKKCDMAITPEDYLDGSPGAKKIDFIDLKRQQGFIRADIEESIHRVLLHGQYIMGPEIKELEEQLSSFVNVTHCITCSSGTDALLMALMALDIGAGDEVITTPYTWISTAEVIALLGARPVFVDIQPDTFNINPDLIEPAITPATRAIMPVGIYGQCADMTRINAIAQKHNLPVIEDAAQSLGATHHHQPSGGLATIGCTSFFPSKPLGCYGDGGAIFTSDDLLADKLRQIRIHGQKVKHQHPLVGINGRLDTLQAAILLEKFELFPEECERRAKIGKRYDTLLAGIPGIQPPAIAAGNTSVYAQYTILTENRDELSKTLKSQNIPSVAYYTAPLHLQGAFADLGHQPGDFPITEQISAQCLSLPMSPYLTADDQKRVAAAMGA